MENDLILDKFTEYCKANGIISLLNENRDVIERYPDNGVTYIGGDYDTIAHFMEEEIGIATPFSVGDRVRHKGNGNIYTVYALPYIDSRRYGLKDKYTGGEINHIVQYGNTLWVQDENGVIEPESDDGAYYLSENEAYYKNFEKV